MDIKLVVDGVEIKMNDFVKRILSNTLTGAISSLHEVKREWKAIEVKLQK